MTRYSASFIIREGALLPADPNAFAKFAEEFDGKVMHVTMKALGEKSPERMRAYYYGPFTDWFKPILRGTGVPATDGAVDLYFMSRFGVARYERLPVEGGEIVSLPILERQSSWSFKRWHDYISDCVYHCGEVYSAHDAPDAQEFLRNKRNK
jgi:hypothetical protein